jgi:hypothetical protein
MKTAHLLFIALGLFVLVASAVADNKNSKGPCVGGFWPDGNGCCPQIIKGKPYWPDVHSCYPIDLDCGVFYADGHG